MEKLDPINENKNITETKDQKTEKVSNSNQNQVPMINESDLNDTYKQMSEVFFHKNQKRGEKVKDVYDFWDNQPVPSFKLDKVVDIGPIDAKNDLDAVRKEPYKLPNNFSWHDIDIKDKKELQTVSFYKNHIIY